MMREENREEELAEALPSIPDSRHSIWTIRAEWIGWFYALFVIQAGPLIFTLWWSENFGGTHDNIAGTITAVVGGSASLIFVAAIVSIIELEAAMVLRHLLIERDARKKREKAEQDRQAELEREKLRAEFERGIELGIEKGRQLEREELSARRNGNNHSGNQ